MSEITVPEPEVAREFGNLLTEFERDTKYWSQRLVLAAGINDGAAASRTVGVTQHAVAQPPSDVTCVRDVALDVWATLGFFEVPPLEDEGCPCISRSDDKASLPPAVGVAGKDLEACDADVFSFVSALEECYAGLVEGEHVAPRLGCCQLLNGVWRVLFNAVFYCATAPCGVASPTGQDVTTRCFHPLRSYEHSCDERPKVGEEEEFPVRLQWHSNYYKVGVDQKDPKRRKWRGSSVEAADPLKDRRPPVSHDSNSKGVRGSVPPESLGSRIKTSPEAEEFVRSSHRSRLSNKHTNADQPLFSSVLDYPVPIESWRFILHKLAALGYKRDDFYVQTPVHSSLHELLLALLWLTKEFQLASAAEHVRMQLTYPFLLRQCSAESNCEDAAALPWVAEARASALSGCTQTMEGGCSTRRLAADTLNQIRSERLLRSFPGAVPWPPASFMEQGDIAYRMQQLQRHPLATTEREDLGTTPAGLPDLSRQLLSIRRLFELSVDRLERTLHQRVEQSALLGSHSDLDVQLCYPAMHEAYKQMCRGLRHMCGLKERLQHIMEQLSRFGSLVAWTIRNAECCSHGCCNYNEHRNRREVNEAMESDEALMRDALAEASELSLRNVLCNFRATRRLGQLRDMVVFLRRKALLNNGRAPQDDMVLPAKVKHNIRTRYSLRSVLSAELLSLKKDYVIPKGVSVSGRIKLPKPRRALLRSFDLVTSFSCPHGKTESANTDSICRNVAGSGCVPVLTDFINRAQAAVVGPPAGSATTSARLEAKRLQGVGSSILEGCGTSEEMCRMLESTLRSLHHHGVRIVPCIGGQ
uniref:Tubulin epsilon and delta complex protein 1 domain-containing protein n=1 Tax=Trypanosoma congolense (strain IL3000) TaxID=1068625 RepID=G0UVF9_TRYCI|nr:conserved hypothetical protein [Trypanosoma congolense IL3000]